MSKHCCDYTIDSAWMDGCLLARFSDSPKPTKPGTEPGFADQAREARKPQSPTTRKPKVNDANETCWAEPLTFRRIVVGFLKNSLACASVRP